MLTVPETPDGRAGAKSSERHPHVAIIRAHYEAFNRADLEALAEGLDPDVEFVPGDAVATAEFGGPLRGRDRVREWFEQLFEVVVNNRVEVAEMEMDGERVVASVYLHGSLRESGVSGALPAVHVFTVRDGLILRNQIFRRGEDR